MFGLGQLLQIQASMPGKGREVLMVTARRSKAEVGTNLKLRMYQSQEEPCFTSPHDWQCCYGELVTDRQLTRQRKP